MSAVDLSVVVVVHDMRREAPRTLHSLSTAYQRGVEASRYEVVVVDNGSAVPLGGEAVASHGDNFRYEYIADASRSPAAAINRGASLAAGRWLGLMIDGARILTPGVISAALAALAAHRDPVVETIGFHLGPALQNVSVRQGYDHQAEDALLARIDWPADGYRLFEIGSLAGSSRRGWYGPLAESNCLFLAAETFARHGGFDERFDEPGGGYVNLDFYRRLLDDPHVTPLRLAGEASFHQVHGGAATGLHPWLLAVRSMLWRRRYRRLRGAPYRVPTRIPALVGDAGPQAEPWLRKSAELWPE